MGSDLKNACDGILQKVVTGKDRVPGVVAMITDRSGNIYEGSAGERSLGAGQAMTTDTVFAIFSTTKAITRGKRPAAHGADPIDTRPGFAELLDRIEGNGVRTVIVEDASRFARELDAGAWHPGADPAQCARADGERR